MTVLRAFNTSSVKHMIDLQHFAAIIFDMDGTLVDSMGTHMQAWQQACEHHRIPFDLSYMYSLGGVPTRKTVEILNEKYNLQCDPDMVATTKRRMWEAMSLTPPLINSTFAVFKHYRPHKRIAIGTGAERSHAEHLLRHHDLLGNIDALVTATDVTFGKPHPETFLTAAQQLGVEPAKCVVFEDTEIGRQAAHDAGMTCIMVHDGHIQA